MTTSVTYKGSADRREVSRADLEKAGATSFANEFKDLVFLKGVPQNVNNEYATALVESGLFVNFEHSNEDDAPPAKQATDKDIVEAGGTPGGSSSDTGTSTGETSGTTGSGTTSGSTGRASRR